MNVGIATIDNALACPSCGSLHTSVIHSSSILIARDGSCMDCNWLGRKEQLIVIDREDNRHPTYDERHKYCPNCGGNNIESTCMGFLRGPDRNHATCHDCKWTGIVHDLVPHAEAGPIT